MYLEPYGTWKKTGKKICTRCLKQKLVEEFPWKSNKNAPSSFCKECNLEYNRDWASRNTESIAKSHEKYRENHREKLNKM